jgi:hypothetical protein
MNRSTWLCDVNVIAFLSSISFQYKQPRIKQHDTESLSVMTPKAISILVFEMKIYANIFVCASLL